MYWGAAVIIAAAIIILLLVLGGKDSYRVIKVYELSGTATVNRKDIGEIDAYNNMVLESGDEIYLKEGGMTLKLDDDKYVYVEPDTKFELVADGSTKNSKTVINLTQGAITNEVQNKLNDESSYEVNTPNSTMAIRGTIVRVYFRINEDGTYETDIDLMEGKVNVAAIRTDGTRNEEKDIEQGYGVIIIDTEGKAAFLNSDPEPIDYSKFSQELLEILLEIIPEDMIEEREKIQEQINLIAEEAEIYTVTFMNGSTVFGTQSIKSGELVSEPILMPEASGSWDFDFSDIITSDTIIYWKE